MRICQHEYINMRLVNFFELITEKMCDFFFLIENFIGILFSPK